MVRKFNSPVRTRNETKDPVMEEEGVRNPGNGGGEGIGYRGMNYGATGMDTRGRRRKTEAEVNE